MDIKTLQYFYTIVEQKGISRAARKLHISQPPLSQRLKMLEDELGTTLIIRSKRQWQLTREGQILYEKVHGLLMQMENLSIGIQEKDHSLVGLVRIGVCPPCLPLLQRVLPSLHKKFSGLSTRVFVIEPLRLENEILISNLDFSLSLLPVQNPHFKTVLLPSQEYVAVYGKKMKAPSKKSVGVTDLTDMPLLLLRRGTGGLEYNTLLQSFQRQGQHPKIIVDSQDSRFLISLLEDGMNAVGILPKVVMDLLLNNFESRALDIPNMQFLPVLIRPEIFCSRYNYLIKEVFRFTAESLGGVIPPES